MDTLNNNYKKVGGSLGFKPLIVAGLLASASITSQAGTAVNGDDWLHVSGNQILDMNNNPVWLTGANWFGFNTSERVFHGLWSVNMETTLDSIASRGINILRVPISTELIKEWQNGIFQPISINVSANPNLNGATSLEVFDAFLAHSKQIGMKVLLDVHSAEADNSGHFAPLWYKGSITPEDFYSTWEWITQRYVNDDTIIAFDLENEPHGQPWGAQEFAKWDNSTDDNNWKYACETASNRILDINPNMLIMCEGIESFPKDGVTWTSNDEDDYYNNWWGGNLRAVKTLPIDLGSRQNQFMYSPHDYGPLVYQQDWFYPGFDKDTLYNDVWKDNWMFIHEEGISPLLIGEWGGFMDGGDNEKWMVAIRDLIIENRLHHTFWCINPNSGDTGGLLNNDWTTWDEEKYSLFKPSLWADNAGKFVSLDHEVALGSDATGVSLNEYLAALNPSVTITAPQDGNYVLLNTPVTVNYAVNKASGVNVYVANSLVGQGSASGTVAITSPSSQGMFTVRLVGIDSSGVELPFSDQITLNAVDEIPILPEIAIVTPAAGASVNTGSAVPVTVTLTGASGFSAELDGVQTSFTGTTGSVTAPAQAGNYPLLVTALDANQMPLSATDSVTLDVKVPSSDVVTCTVGTADTWPTGFVINTITLTNTGTSTINGWSATLNFANSISGVNVWNANFTTDAQSVTATNVAHNAVINPGQSVTFGLQGAYSGSFSLPSCTVN
ncbi:cellulase [Marinomonas agarivorans]|nr:cellulase [Marinomonas agarivorans]